MRRNWGWENEESFRGAAAEGAPRSFITSKGWPLGVSRKKSKTVSNDPQIDARKVETLRGLVNVVF